MTSEFDDFLSNFENLLNFAKGLKQSFTIILGNSNARSKSWWSDNTTSPEGIDINSFTTTHGLHQLISDPTHLLPKPLSCIDLIFTDQPNLAVHYSAHPSMHLIVIIKLFIVSFMIEYPPPYECLVWEYRCSHQNAIAQTLDQID